MLIDRREIEFDVEALLAAVATSQRAAESFGLPAFPPNGARFDPKQAAVDFLYGPVQAQRSVRLKAEMVGALLVAYCIRSRIPMPRKINKAVRVEANSVILAFRSEYAQAPTPAAEIKAMAAAVPVASWTWLEPERVPAR